MPISYETEFKFQLLKSGSYRIKKYSCPIKHTDAFEISVLHSKHSGNGTYLKKHNKILNESKQFIKTSTKPYLIRV